MPRDTVARERRGGALGAGRQEPQERCQWEKGPMPRAARGARKNAWRCIKTLTLRARLPTILPYTVVSEAWVPPELLKGQRGSFGRQPSLAPPPRGVCSWCVTSI